MIPQRFSMDRLLQGFIGIDAAASAPDLGPANLTCKIVVLA